MVAGMDVLVRTFLEIVQPNDFPSDLIGDFIRHGLSNEAAIRAALKYELGFLVCLAIGLLYIVLMPLIGVCLARQKTSRPGSSAPLYWGAYITVMAVILVGNVYLYISNAAIKRHVDDSTKEIIGTLNNLHKYTGGLLGNIERGMNGSVNFLIERLRNTSEVLGGQIKNVSVAGLRLAEFEGHNKSISNFNITPKRLHFLRILGKLGLVDKQGQGKTQFEALFEASKALNRSLFEFQNQLNGIGFNLNNTLKGNKDYLNKITKKIENVTKDVENMDNVNQTFNDLQKSLDNVSHSANEIFVKMKNETTKITPVVKKVGYIVWAVGVALCCLLVLVLVRNILGLLVGSVGVGPVVSFLVCSMLMVVVMPLFLLGGHSYTLVCKPWENGELFRFIDKRIELGAMLGLNSSLKLTDVYNDCSDKRSLWDTLHLEELLDPKKKLLNVPQGLDVSKFMGAFNDMNITFLNQTQTKLPATLLVFTKFTNEFNNAWDPNEPDEIIKDNMEDLKKTVDNITTKVDKIIITVNVLMNESDNATNFLSNINTTIGGMVRAYLDNFTAGLTAEFTSHIKTVNCMTLAKEVDKAKSFICGNMVTSLNTFWFSLGMCLIFFIPSIVLSIKLAKYYRAEEPPSVQDLGRSAASLQRDQLKLMRKKAMDQFGHLKPTEPFVETDDYEYVYVKTT